MALLAFATLAHAQTGVGRPAAIATPVPVPRVPTMQVPSPVVPARFQPPGTGRPYTPTGEDARLDYQIQLEPPGLERLMLSLASDADLQERIRQETLKRDPNERTTFPEEPILSRDRYYGRGGVWPHRGLIVEPNYVSYNRLFFEDKNTERYGWELGMLQPFVSAGLFFWDVATFPFHVGTDPCRKDESNAGYCLPGDPVPYRLYPLEITSTGTLTEVAVILGLVILFP